MTAYKFRVFLGLSMLFVFLSCTPSQLPHMPDVSLPTVTVPVEIPGLEGILTAEPPISTTLEDALYEAPELDGFNPQDFILLAEMPRTPEGGFYLLPGVYEFTAQSYCLKAGTYAPRTSGDGYLYAPLLGPKADIVQRILERSVVHPEIEQRDIQVLLWAIIARHNLSDMPGDMQLTAAKLLSPEELFELNGGALGLVPEEMMQDAFANLPPLVRQTLEAEARLRRMLSSANSSYEDLERSAVLTGIAPAEDLVREIPDGRWSLHPDGFYVRYFPSGYSTTRIELYVPEMPLALNTKTLSAWQFGQSRPRELPDFNPAEGAGMPGNASSQRLGQSARKAAAEDTIAKAKEMTDTLAAGSDILGGVGNYVGFYIPNKIIGFLLDFNYDYWGEAAKALGGDPPRSDFTVLAMPESFSYPILEPRGEMSVARAEASNALLDAALELSGLLRAANITLDRLGGAQMAQDDTWIYEQAVLLVYYKREAGFAIQRVAGRLEILLEVLRQEGFADINISVQMVRDYQQRLQSEGWTADELAAATMFNLTENQLELLKNKRLELPAEQVAGNLFSKGDETITRLSEVAARWMLLPEVSPPEISSSN